MNRHKGIVTIDTKVRFRLCSWFAQYFSASTVLKVIMSRLRDNEKRLNLRATSISATNSGTRSDIGEPKKQNRG